MATWEIFIMKDKAVKLMKIQKKVQNYAFLHICWGQIGFFASRLCPPGIMFHAPAVDKRLHGRTDVTPWLRILNLEASVLAFQLTLVFRSQT